MSGRVLVVEDEVEMQRALRTGLQYHDFDVRAVGTGEEAIRALGFRQYRVRVHGTLVRIEIGKDELAKALTLESAHALASIFKQLGFLYVTLDLEGYRQGSLNAAL